MGNPRFIKICLRQRTKDFNILYKTILEKYYPNVPKYDDIIRKYHQNRNFLINELLL